MAPEQCLKQPYDSKVDIWAVGVISFLLLSGSHPFVANKKDMQSQICHSKPDFSKINNQVSQRAKKFLEACLQKSADKRPSASDLLNMDWLKNSFLSQS